MMVEAIEDASDAWAFREPSVDQLMFRTGRLVEKRGGPQ
jgi:hypothetical protein